MTDSGHQYYQPTPLDFLILERLPDKGILGGVHWAGRPLKHVREDINALLGSEAPQGDPVAMSTIQSRVRAMSVAGYVEGFASHGSGRIWARTPAGVDFLATRQEVLGV